MEKKKTTQASAADVEMDNQADGDARDSKKHRRIFTNPTAVIRNYFFGGCGDSDDNSADEDDDDDSSDNGSDME